MRKWFVVLAATVSLVCGVAGLAGAAPMNWSGTLTVELWDVPPFELHGGGVATVNSSAGVVPAHLNTLRLKGSRGNVGGTGTVIITDPDSVGNGIARVIVDLNAGTGTFAPISGGAASTTVLTRAIMPIRGIAKICLLTTSCTTFLPLLLTASTTVNGEPASNLRGVGVGGTVTAGGEGIRISLEGAPWTIKTTTATDHIETPGGNTTFTAVTAKGFAHDPSSATTSTAQPSGVVQLVTPGQLITNLPFGTAAKLSVLISLTVHFIPEPGWLLLLSSGVVGLAMVGRKRMRR